MKQYQTPRKRISTELVAKTMEGEGGQCGSDHRRELLQSLHMKSLAIGPSKVPLTSPACAL